MRSLLRAGRLAGGLLILWMAVDNIVVQYGRNPSFSLVNFFGYFTVLSNLFAAGVLLTGVFRPVPTLVRGAAVLYMAVTGLVYATLLSGYEALHAVTPAGANLVWHKIMPVAMIVDWIADPPRDRLTVRRALVWLVFPVVYLVYTLARGLIADWYPYPFLDPTRPGGYGNVAAGALTVTAVFVVLGLLVVWSGNVLRRRRGPGGAEVTAPDANVR